MNYENFLVKCDRWNQGCPIQGTEESETQDSCFAEVIQ